MTFGAIEGVGAGSNFKSRRELYDAGVHRTLQAGIVGRQKDGAESVVLSGGYVDDEDFGDVIVYTGDGGQNDKGQQVSDQDFEGKNQALFRNHLEDVPVRVIRGASHRSDHSPTDGYRYDGLFRVERCWREKRSHGFLVCRYRLIKIEAEDAGLPQNEEGRQNSSGPAPRADGTYSRIVRDRDLAQRVKDWHGYACVAFVLKWKVDIMPRRLISAHLDDRMTAPMSKKISFVCVQTTTWPLTMGHCSFWTILNWTAQVAR